MIFGSWIFSCEWLTTFTLWYYHIESCHCTATCIIVFCVLHKDVKTFISVEVKQLCLKKKKKKAVCLFCSKKTWMRMDL